MRYLGGKSRVAKQLVAQMPDVGGAVYEPFCGGGAMTVALAEEGDIWELTIDGEAGAYRMVQDAFIGHRRHLHETDGKIITASRKVWPDND